MSDIVDPNAYQEENHKLVLTITFDAGGLNVSASGTMPAQDGKRIFTLIALAQTLEGAVADGDALALLIQAAAAEGKNRAIPGAPWGRVTEHYLTTFRHALREANELLQKGEEFRGEKPN